MAQGTRGRWLRVAVTGLGVVLCTGLIGCKSSDQSKDKTTKLPGTGLPGTPTLPSGTAGSAMNRMPTTSGTAYNGNNTTFAGNGSNLIQTGGTVPASATSAGSGSGRYYTDGRNTNTGGIAPQPGYMTAPVGAQGTISAPTPPSSLMPGQPTGGPVGYAPQPVGGANSTAYSPPGAAEMPLLPPSPPPYSSGGRASDFASGPVAPPLTPPVAPRAPLMGGGGGTFGGGIN